MLRFIIICAAGAAAQPLAPFDLPWDPAPLQHDWLMANLTLGSAPPEDPAGRPPNCIAATTSA